MKKLFSLFAAVLFAGSMMAADVTVSKSVHDLYPDDENGTQEATLYSDDVISISVNADGNNGKVYGTGTEWRLYQSNNAVVTVAATDATIKTVAFEFTVKNTGVLNFGDAAITSQTAVNVNAASAQFVVANSGTAVNGQVIIKSFTVVYEAEAGGVTPPEPTCTLSDFLGNGSGNAAYTDRFKVCLPEGVSVVNIQSSFGTEAGIYLTFPGSDFGAVSLDATQYATQGAGMLLYVSAFLSAAETEVTVECGGVTYTITVLNANPETPALPDPTNCAEAREAALSVSANNELYKDGAVYSITGYVTEIAYAYSASANNMSFWMADAADGGKVLEAYKVVPESADAIPAVGDKVTVTGSLTKYNTTPEFAAGCTVVIVEHGTPVVPQNLGEKTIAEFLTLANTVDTCVLTGVVTSITNDTYGNLYLADGNDTLYVYGVLTPAGEAKKFGELNVAVNDTLTVKAVYSLYNNAPQAKNAVFVAVKKAPVAPADTITIDIESEVQYTDYVAAAGWWQFMAENDEYEISISNVSTTQAAGTYTIADLDADYSYVFIKADSVEVHFVDGSFVLTEGEGGSRTIEGTVTGDDGNIYNIKLVFRIPTAETTVNVEIPEWGVADAAEYYGYTGTLFYGEAADGTYVQFVVLGNNPVGTFTYDDMLPTATGIEVAGNFKAIYSMNVTVNATQEMRAIITMDILCLNNTLYHVTTTIGEGIEDINAAVKAIKSIVNGQVVIEKAGKTYNMNGAVIR